MAKGYTFGDLEVEFLYQGKLRVDVCNAIANFAIDLDTERLDLFRHVVDLLDQQARAFDKISSQRDIFRRIGQGLKPGAQLRQTETERGVG